MTVNAAKVSATSQRDSLLNKAWTEPACGAFLLLRTGFTVLPIVFGLDKFTNILTDWEAYLAPWVVNLLPFDARTAMILIGIVELVAGILVAIRPRYGAYVVALWLAGIVLNLLTYPGFYDVALRDFGLLLAALTLGRLSSVYNPARRGTASNPR
jgi:uncharacterized membrane protein YphA (DoxX/SURF4 family)